MSKQVMEQALETLEAVNLAYPNGECVPKAIASLKEAIKQYGEPVAWLYTFDGYTEALMPDEVEQDNKDAYPNMYKPLYTLAPTIPEGWPQDHYENVAEFLKKIGWRAQSDAQWHGLRDSLPELFTMLAAADHKV